MRDLDVLTDIGHRTPEGDRAELGYPGGGPQWLITELGVFDYADGHARLRALWPDVTLADVDGGHRVRPPGRPGGRVARTADARPSSPPCGRSTRSASDGWSSAPTS